MREAMLEYLRDPVGGEPFTVRVAKRQGDEILEGELVAQAGGATHPIVNGIPRFVPVENYAVSFGFQWQRFAELQTDSRQTHRLSHDRFYAQTGLSSGQLEGLRVLEAGCGGGRFSEVVLEADAELCTFDLSHAVDKNRELHGDRPNFHIAQASILAPPFAQRSFDLVFCFGVLQHTPDPEASFRALVPFVKPGGLLCVDVYAAHPKQSLHWKYVLRPLARHMDHETLLGWIERAARALVPVSRQVRRIPALGKPLSRFIPIVVHDGFMGLVPREDEVRMAVLETFDALSPAFDKPRRLRTVGRWFQEAGFEQVELHCQSHALNWGRGRAPTPRASC